jgi:hypothetical protein
MADRLSDATTQVTIQEEESRLLNDRYEGLRDANEKIKSKFLSAVKRNTELEVELVVQSNDLLQERKIAEETSAKLSLYNEMLATAEDNFAAAERTLLGAESSLLVKETEVNRLDDELSLCKSHLKEVLELMKLGSKSSDEAIHSLREQLEVWKSALEAIPF